MKFQITTDYAIRILVYLTQHDEQIFTARELSDCLKIPYNYLNKVVASMRQANLIHSVQGPKGGYCLSTDAGEVSLYEIIESMEGSIRINRCLEADGYCSMYGSQSGICVVHQYLASVQEDIINILKCKKIKELC